MNPILFPKLDCFHNSIINIAILFKLNYTEAFSALWSDTDFTYEESYQLYFLNKLLKNLEALGIQRDVIRVSSKQEALDRLTSISPGECILLGMDTFDIPWVPFYQTLHVTHYFIAQKEMGNTFSCLDLIYDTKQRQRLSLEAAVKAFYFCHVYQKEQKPLPVTGVVEEAQAVLDQHLETQERIEEQMRSCIGSPPAKTELLGKYIHAMIKNRSLYQHYLETKQGNILQDFSFFDYSSFKDWLAVKNGLFKASLLPDNKALIEQLCKQFTALMQQESLLAEKLIASNSITEF